MREGQLLEQGASQLADDHRLALLARLTSHVGIMNVRALQEVMDAQTLAYIFPFSQFSFPTDISCIVLAEGRKSAFFKGELNVPLKAPTDPASVAALYKPKDALKMPPKEKLDAFRNLIVGARCGKVQVPEATSEVCRRFVVARKPR